MPSYYLRNGDCGTERAFKIIGTKWTPQIIEQIVHNSDSSYSEIKQKLRGISDSMLSRKIAQLLENDIILRTENGTFALTQKGDSILPAMTLMQKLANDCDYPNSGANSSVEYIGKLIGSKWKSRIIWIIFHSKVIRFNALHNSIEGISHKILIEQLNDLVENGFVLKTDYLEKNPKVEYQLTETGMQAYYIIQALSDWCLRYELIKPTISISY